MADDSEVATSDENSKRNSDDSDESSEGSEFSNEKMGDLTLESKDDEKNEHCKKHHIDFRDHRWSASVMRKRSLA